jgi:4-diphosphocytidyl-2-C-methyl-D-erythritol kinase
VPRDSSNTCFRIAERATDALKARGRVIIHIEKRLPVQGGLGGSSGNAVATLLALELALKKRLREPEKLRIAAEVGSDLPLFLIGGTVLGVSRGEEVYPLPDLSSVACVIATPDIAVSTPKAFADWDKLFSAGAIVREGQANKLTHVADSDRLKEFGYVISSWLKGASSGEVKPGKNSSGVPVSKGRGRAETPLLDLVRTGIENDFEKVVFPQYPELRDVKRVLDRLGALYASLSGSGSAIYGIFGSKATAQKAAAYLIKRGVRAIATTTLTRRQFQRKFLVSNV